MQFRNFLNILFLLNRYFMKLSMDKAMNMQLLLTNFDRFPYFLKKNDIIIKPDLEILLKDREKVEENKKDILCAFCGKKITKLIYSISMNGKINQTFKNPAGISYEISCFYSAPGCIVRGEPAEEFTWFPGFTWSFAFCSSCFSQMGWYYQSGEKSFYGLIVKNLLFP